MLIESKEHPFGSCSNCGEDFNSELISEYDMKCCIRCGAKLSEDVSLNHKMYELIMEDGIHVYKHLGIYVNEEEAKRATTGNGEVIRIKDVTDKFPISGDKLFKALINGGFEQIEANAIYSLFQSEYGNSIY